MKRLTRKQASFIQEVVKGKNATQAALSTYNTNSVNSAKVIGSRLLTNVNIREALGTVLRSHGLSLDVLTKNIGNLANATPAKVTGETILKANIELLKLQGAYPDKKSFNFNMSITERWQKMSYNEAKVELEKLNETIAELRKEEDS